MNGETAFRLYDTYGFPLDLTQDALRARGLSVDTEGFNAAMERQRADARRAWSGSGEAATETVWYGLRERVGATEFLGYETESAEGVIRAIVKDGVEVEKLTAGERGSLILNQTPFYGESGGQVGDVGEITASGFRAEVTDTRKKLGDLVVHDVTIVEGAASLGLAVELKVDHAARTATRANHSATHILHEALRIVLGDHVAQKGSLVSPERLRFDIAHPKPITRAELEKVEDIANRVVLENAEVTTRLMGLDDARASGARALFGEKYGDEVRVVSMGEIDDGQRPRADLFDRALRRHACSPHRRHRPHHHRRRKRGRGGREAHRSEDAGRGAQVARSATRAVTRISRLCCARPRARLPQRLEALIEDKRKLERELADAKRKLAMGGGGREQADAARDVAGVKLYARAVSGVEMKDLKSLADDAKQSVGSGVVAIAAASEDGKASIVVAVTPDLTSRFNAVDLVRLGSAALGGKGGGGRPDMAQAGGPDGAKTHEALAAVEEGVRRAAGVRPLEALSSFCGPRLSGASKNAPEGAAGLAPLGLSFETPRSARPSGRGRCWPRGRSGARSDRWRRWSEAKLYREAWWLNSAGSPGRPSASSL